MISVAASAILLMEPLNYLVQSRPGPFSSLNQFANITRFENITCTECSSWNFFFLQHWENDSLHCLVSSLPAAVDSTPFCRLHSVDKTAPVTCKHSAFPEKLQRNFIVYPNSAYWLDGLRTLEFSGTNKGYFFLVRHRFGPLTMITTHRKLLRLPSIMKAFPKVLTTN